MVTYAYEELFHQDSLPKNIIIAYDNVTLTNSDIVSESLELTETLCPDENITLGSCNASQIKFRIGYIAQSLIGKTITVSIQPQGGAVLQIGVYKIETDTRTADRRYKDIVAYDVMKDILEADVTDWYNGLFSTPSTTYTLKQFRDSFFTHVGVTQETATLINDTLTVSKTIDPEVLSGKDVITRICEINGCFGHIGRDGKFKYIYLSRLIPTLYPAEDLYPSETLYPSDGIGLTTVGENGSYINGDYEDYVTAPITKLQIRNNEDDIGKIVGTGTNCYIIQDNFLAYGLTDTQLTNIATSILNKLADVEYIPMNVETKGNPCLEVGDGIEFATAYDVVYSYIFKRTLKGIQALFDTYESEGKQTLETNINSVNQQIIQLKGRTNELRRTIDETVSELSMYETATDGTLTSYDTRITQNATAITSEATARSEGDAATLSTARSEITQSAQSITSSVAQTYETKTDASTSYSNLETTITQTASGIRTDVAATYETKTDAGTQYQSLSSSIEQNAQAITTKVSNGEISSKISQEAGQVSLSADRLVVDSSYFTLDANGEGSLGGLSFDANGFYSKELDSIVLQVHPNPVDGWALSVGTSETFRAFLVDADTYYLVNYQGSYPFAIGHEGEVYVTNLQVKNEYSRSGSVSPYVYSKTSEGRLHVDDYISCWGNIEIGTRDITSDPTRSSEEVRSGSLYVRKSPYDGEGKTGNVVADNYITALGYGTGSGDIEAAHDLIYGNACYQSSDERLKKDIKDLENSEEFIYGLRPVSYRLIDNDEEVHRGFIAQEVEPLVEEDSAIVGENLRTNYKTLAYTELIADLVKTVQSQNERITALENRVAELEGN